MKAKVLLFLGVLLLLAGSASALRSPAIAAPTGLTCSYVSACAQFTWDAGTGADLNDFVMTVTSNDPSIADQDLNTLNNTLSICGANPDYWVQGVLSRYDGNADGLYQSITDSTCIVDPGGTLAGGQYLLYNTFVMLGALMLCIVIVAVLVIFVSRTGILNFRGMFKK